MNNLLAVAGLVLCAATPSQSQQASRPQTIDRAAAVSVLRGSAPKESALAVDRWAALASLDDANARDELSRMMNDANNSAMVRARAAATLADLGEPGAEAQLLKQAEGLRAQDAFGAARALGRRSSPAVAAALGRILDDPSPFAQMAAADELGRQPAAAAVPLLNAYLPRAQSVGRLAAITALTRHGDASARETLASMIGSIRGTELLPAGAALLSVGDMRGLQAVRDAATGDNELLRLDAAVVLRAYDAPAADAIIDAGLSSSNRWLRLRAVESFAQTGRRPTAKVRALLEDSEESVRLHAAQAIASAK
jgi:HEAT repeat protein